MESVPNGCRTCDIKVVVGETGAPEVVAEVVAEVVVERIRTLFRAGDFLRFRRRWNVM